MTKLSVSEAIRLSPVARATFYRMLEKGEISSSVDGRGKRSIDLSELQRVFGELKDKAVKKESKGVEQSQKLSEQTEMNEMRLKIQFLEQQLRDKSEQLSEVKEREKRAEERLDIVLRQLEYKPTDKQSEPQGLMGKFSSFFK